MTLNYGNYGIFLILGNLQDPKLRELWKIPSYGVMQDFMSSAAVSGHGLSNSHFVIPQDQAVSPVSRKIYSTLQRLLNPLIKEYS